MSRRTILDCTRLAAAGTQEAIGAFEQKQWERLCNQYKNESARKDCLQNAKTQEDEHALEQEFWRAQAEEANARWQAARNPPQRAEETVKEKVDRMYDAAKDNGREEMRLNVKNEQRSAMDSLRKILAELEGEDVPDRDDLAKRLRAAIQALDRALLAPPL